MNHLPLKIAFRYLFSKKSHSAVNIISAISICAVAVTSMAMICVLSVFNGFSGLVNDKLSQIDPEIKITAANTNYISNADSIITAVKQCVNILYVAPSIESRALATYNGLQIPITVKGVTPDFAKMTNISDLVKEDGQYILSKGNQYFSVISVGVAISLNAHPGYFNTFEIYTPKRKGAVNPANPTTAFRSKSTYISGVFEVQQQDYDTEHVIIDIDLARELFDYDKCEATSIDIQTAPGTNIDALMQKISSALGSQYIVQNRLMQHSHSLKMINAEKWITLLLLGFILIIASFNIISTLAIIITEKDESITTLRSLGASNKMISRIFVIEGWLISLFGAISGIIIGLILCLVQQYTGIIKMSTNAQALIIDAYPVIVEWTDVIAIIGIVAAVGFLTSQATAIAMHRRLVK